MTIQIFNNFLYLLKLSSETEVLWTIFPLAIATLVMLIYFEKYYDEEPGWNTYVANSLVLLFVSVILFRYLFQLNDAGIMNIINYPSKFAVSSMTFLLGMTLLFLDFGHFFPQKIAKEINSPLTINLIGYTLLLLVYSKVAMDWHLIIALFALFLGLLIVLHSIKIPIKKFFLHLKKIKQKEEIEKVVCAKNDIECQKKELKRREKELKRQEIKKINNQKKEIKKITKIVDKL